MYINIYVYICTMKVTKEHIITNSVASARRKVIGVYFLIDKNDEIVYVGSGVDVLARLQAHRKDNSKIFNRHFIIELTGSEIERRLEIEMNYTKEFMPKYNKRNNPRYKRVLLQQNEDGTRKYGLLTNNLINN